MKYKLNIRVVIQIHVTSNYSVGNSLFSIPFLNSGLKFEKLSVLDNVKNVRFCVQYEKL